MLERAMSLVIGYVFGSFLTANFVCERWTGKPATEIGQKNPGMTNVWRNVGWFPGLLVLIGDILKTLLAMAISWVLFESSVGRICLQYAGLGAVLGHDYPITSRKKGGSGVTATTTWMIIGLGIPGCIAALVAVAVIFLTGLMPLAAVVLALAAVIVAFATAGIETGLVFTAALVVMVCRHWHRLGKVVRGEEAYHLKLFGKRRNANNEAEAAEAAALNKQLGAGAAMPPVPPATPAGAPKQPAKEGQTERSN